MCQWGPLVLGGDLVAAAGSQAQRLPLILYPVIY